MLDLEDDTLLHIIRSLRIDDSIFPFLSTLKTTCRRVHTLVLREMTLDQVYSTDLREFHHFWPGSRIPCGAPPAQIQPMYWAQDQEDMWEILQATAITAPNGINVSGCFGYEDVDTDACDSWEESGSIGEDGSLGEDRSFYLIVNISFRPEDILYSCCTTLHPANGRVNLKRVPDVFRCVLQMPAMAYDSETFDSFASRESFTYMRLVQVHEHHTLLDVYTAIKSIEGWHTKSLSRTANIDLPTQTQMLGPCLSTDCGANLHPECSVLEYFDQAHVPHALEMEWPVLPSWCAWLGNPEPAPHN